MDTIPYSAELAARLTVARDAAAAYGRSRREFRAGGAPLDWYHWSERLCMALDGLIDLIDSGSAQRPRPDAGGSAAAMTGLRTDVRVTLSAAEIVTVRDALRYVLEVRTGALTNYRDLLERIEASP